MMKKLLALLAVLALALVSLAACAGGIEGTWKMDVDADDLPGNITETDLAFTFSGNGTYEATAFGKTRTGSYTYDKDSGSLTLDGTAYDCVLDGNKLTLTMNGETMRFTRK